MRNSYPTEQEDQSEINMAPMLDVVFILLIFFVVTASFVKEMAVPVTLPLAAAPSPDTEVESIVVKVEPAGVFTVNGHVMSRGSLEPFVQSMHAENPGADYAVLLAKGSRVRDTVVAVDAGRRIGLGVVPISTVD